MKTILLAALFTASGIMANAQNTCPATFKRNNGNGTCGSMGELRLNYSPVCPTVIPYIDSVYTNGTKCAVTFGIPDASKCNNNNSYISYCVTSGNMPPANVWTIFFRNPDGSQYSCTVTSSTSASLPVVFSAFDATAKQGSVACQWTTEQEINNNYFELERSFDGRNFKPVAMIFSYESNSSIRRQYSYTDKSSSLQGKTQVWYRIRQVDLDGQSSYSKVISLRFRNTPVAELQVMPNPFRSQMEIQVEAAAAGKAELRLLNTEGRVILASTTNVNKGRNLLRLSNLEGFSNGMYILQCTVNGETTGISKLMKY